MECAVGPEQVRAAAEARRRELDRAATEAALKLAPYARAAAARVVDEGVLECIARYPEELDLFIGPWRLSAARTVKKPARKLFETFLAVLDVDTTGLEQHLAALGDVLRQRGFSNVVASINWVSFTAADGDGGCTGEGP